MIKFSHVSLIYPNSTKTVLEDLNLTIDEGELVLVIGPTGSGKSSLLRLIREIIETLVMVYTIAGTGNSDHLKNEIDLADRELVQRLLDHCLSRIVNGDWWLSPSTILLRQ